MYITGILHKFLMKETDIAGIFKVNYSVCLESLKMPDCFKLFLCIQAVFTLFMLLSSISRISEFSGKTSQLTSKIETPEASGKNQHGSARWLKKSEYDSIYDTAVINFKKVKKEDIRNVDSADN